MEKKDINKKYCKYDESFKPEILKMVKTGRSVAEVSRSMAYIFYIFFFFFSLFNY
jgi:hypothetical protein